MSIKPEQITLTKSGMLSQESIIKINQISKDRKVAITRLIGYAIDNELSKEIPFQFDYALPVDEYIENAYAVEANKILDYFKTINRGLPLDTLLLIREKIGVPDKQRLLYGMRECLKFNRLIQYKADRNERYAPVADNYFHYMLADTPKKVKKTKEEKEYDQYLKLQKSLKAKGMLDE